MAMHFRHVRGISPAPVIPLGGVCFRPRTLLDVCLIGPAGSVTRQALLDCGADDTVFTEAVAAQLGIDLSLSPQHTLAGIGSPIQVVRYAVVTLRLTDGIEYREWPAWVGFVPTRMTHPTLGYAGCLQFFDVMLRGAAEEIEMEINTTYPGR